MKAVGTSVSLGAPPRPAGLRRGWRPPSCSRGADQHRADRRCHQVTAPACTLQKLTGDMGHDVLAGCKLSMSLPAPGACYADHGSCMNPMRQVACLLLLGLRRGQQKVKPCLSSLLGALPAEGLLGFHVLLMPSLPLQQFTQRLPAGGQQPASERQLVHAQPCRVLLSAE